MLRIGRRGLIASLPGITFMGSGVAAERVKLTVGSATEGGGFASYSAAFIDAIRTTDSSLDLNDVATKGSAENFPLLEAGKLDLAFVQGAEAYQAFTGLDRSVTKVKVVTAMYGSPGMFIVRTDSRHRSITDLKGRPVVWGVRESGLTLLGRSMMAAIGLDIDKDFQSIYVTRALDGPTAVLDRSAAALWGGGRRSPSLVKVARELGGARFVAPNPTEREIMLAKNKYMKRLTVAAGTYPGQPEAIDSVGSWAFVLARADLDEEVGYRLAVALHKVERSGTTSKLLEESTVANTIAASPGPEMLQDGVRRYYKEARLQP